MIFLTIDRVDIENACDKIKDLIKRQCTEASQLDTRIALETAVESIISIVNKDEDFGYDTIYKLETYTKTLEIICGNNFWWSWEEDTESNDNKRNEFQINLFIINQIIDKYKRIHIDQHAICESLDCILLELKEIKRKLK